LFRMARDSETLKTAAGLKEARAALLEAHRLSTEMTKGRSHERLMIERELRTGA
jgi:cellobiose-specific phosphotransferase system component IIA